MALTLALRVEALVLTLASNIQALASKVQALRVEALVLTLASKVQALAGLEG